MRLGFESAFKYQKISGPLDNFQSFDFSWFNSDEPRYIQHLQSNSTVSRKKCSLKRFPPMMFQVMDGVTSSGVYYIAPEIYTMKVQYNYTNKMEQAMQVRVYTYDGE